MNKNWQHILSRSFIDENKTVHLSMKLAITFLLFYGITLDIRKRRQSLTMCVTRSSPIRATRRSYTSMINHQCTKNIVRANNREQAVRMEAKCIDQYSKRCSVRVSLWLLRQGLQLALWEILSRGVGGVRSKATSVEERAREREIELWEEDERREGGCEGVFWMW